MNILPGSQLHRPHAAGADVVVVGSGPAGATVARALARAGMSVIVIEEGAAAAPDQLGRDGFTAMAHLYRDMGAMLTQGRPLMPLVQGRLVGGTSVVNGAISWRLPRDVHAAWVAADPVIGDALPWGDLEALFEHIEDDLHIRPTDDAVAGAKNLLMARGADALGLEHRPIARNVHGCRGLGRCLQGCPEGHKMSMERTYLPDACAAGAVIWSEVRADRIILAGNRAVGVSGIAAGGARVTASARRAVVLAASALQTPALLLASGIRGGPVGEGFQCHPGVAVAGRFAEPIGVWHGATQGHEVIGLRHTGLKFEVLGYDMALVAGRQKGTGATLTAHIAEMVHQAHWGAAVRARARGRVRQVAGRPLVTYSLTREDTELVRRGVRVLCELFLAAGADWVEPGVFGWRERVADRGELDGFDDEAPRDPRAYSLAATHLFGTCRMGGNPAFSVVRPDFRHHRVDHLYVADSSVFPSNTGVNPQTSIIALAAMCARRLLAA